MRVRGLFILIMILLGDFAFAAPESSVEVSLGIGTEDTEPYLGVWFTKTDKITLADDPSNFAQSAVSLIVDKETFIADLAESTPLYLCVKMIGYESADFSVSCDTQLSNASAASGVISDIPWTAAVEDGVAASSATDTAEAKAGSVTIKPTVPNGSYIVCKPVTINTQGAVPADAAGTYQSTLTVTFVAEEGSSS